MKKIFKGLGLGFLALALVVGVGANNANATTTYAVNAITETGALTITSAGTLGLVAGANTINIGADATAKTIAIGGAAAETINIGATNTSGVITLGNSAQTGVTTISGSTLAGTNSLFAASSTSAITIGAGLTTGNLTLGKATQSSGITTIHGGTAAANTLFDNVTGGTIAIGVANTGGITIGNGDTIKTISIGAGDAVNTIKIGDNATPANVITIGGVASGTTVKGTLTVGADDTGHDVLLYGATASSNLLWDESADALELAGVARLDLSGATVLAANTDGGVIKAGTSGSPITEDTADMKFMSAYFDNGATSGTSVGDYKRLYVTGAGGSGQALRAFGSVTDVAAGNIYGAHISASFGTTGSITGLGNALATTLHIPGAMTGGTYASQTAEIWADAAASDLAGATSKSFFRVGMGGDATGIALMDDTMNLFDFYGIAAGTGNTIDTAQTGSAGGGAYAGIRVNIPGVGVKYIRLFDADTD